MIGARNNRDPIRPRLSSIKGEDDLQVVVKLQEVEVGDMELFPLDEVDDPSAEGEGDIIELSDEEEECAPRRVAPDPGDPTSDEREDHNVDHLPFRSWCDACVEG